MKLDTTDVQILNLLKQNSKYSLRKLAEQVHLSAPSVAERVRKLEAAGIIAGYTMQINRKALGYTIDCWIEVTLRTGDSHRFTTFIRHCPTIIRCYCIAGRACYMLLLTADSLTAVERVIKQMAPFAETVTHIVLSEVPIADRLIEQAAKRTQ
ncbi:MAG: Lrp/AsnC family transcriptional regulator [Sporolactobacillus sp.]|jgi:Lrp/AsnC family leucine-responsive transcriptional regulator|nr:Lrp/AsnC family transcriptional regulator [Sporolactobacillus sp.]